MLTQSRRALEYLHARNLSSRATANWTLGFAYMLQGDRVAARQSYMESIRLGQECGNIFTTSLATNDLGYVQEIENQLPQAAETYQHALQLFGDQPQPHAGQASLGLARISYEWNDLDAAEQYGQQSLQLVRQYDRTIDRYIASEVLLARVKLARGDVTGAAALLAQSAEAARQKDFTQRLPEVAAIQVLTLLRQGQAAAAAQLARQYDLPLSQARVLIAQGDPAAALAVLEPFRLLAEARGWADERLRVMALQALALHLKGDKAQAAQALAAALALAEPGGFIRLFVDEGEPMARLLSEAADPGIMLEYVGKLLAAFGDLTKDERRTTKPASSIVRPSSLVEPLSGRELEILKLIAHGLSNRAIGERLFLALDTVKGHNRRIFDKLQAQSRTEAIARARELGLL